MISRDFEQSKYPICRRAPVICFFENGLTVVYNRFDLRAFFAKNGTTCRCVGVWPGKKSTDCFTLNSKSYSLIDTPPEIHKEIDSAESIAVTLDENGAFEEITYIPSLFFEGRTPIVSKEKALFEYVRKVGLRYAISLSSSKNPK
jgi:hypothetical protein